MQKLIIALLTVAATATAAHAEGSYVGAGVSRSGYDFNINSGTASTTTSGHVTSGKLFGGYELDKTWAVEGGWIDFGKASSNYTLGATSGQIETDGRAFYAAGKGSYALNDQWSLYGKLGLARSHATLHTTGISTANNSADKTGVFLGTGVQYQLSKQVALSLDVERYGKNAAFASQAKIENTNTVSLSAKMNF